MEVGAVKQAFNNELILLKKKLTQAKIQIIHKLTRKAKTLVEKKAPDALKEKLKKKAESAVNEVLIIKKIKPKDVGKFILTHEGKLQDYLNKPQVDQDKACARLLLHKAMQDKYKFIRSRFAGVPINDLFMSRLERRKMKKEEREQKKKKGKGKVVNAEGDWDVEDLGKGKDDKNFNGSDMGNDDVSADEDVSCNERSDGDDSNDDDGGIEAENESEESDKEDGPKVDLKTKKDRRIKLIEQNSDSENDANEDESDKELSNTGQFVKFKPNIEENKFELRVGKPLTKNSTGEDKTIEKTEKKKRDVIKNKNFNEKILNKKFKKDSKEAPQKEVKVVDPFFITSSGENYLSLAEPREPDEVKEIHKQGNRKLRRAVMFGHVPKIRPRQEFRQDNDRFSRNNGFNKGSENKYNRDNFNDRNDRFNNRQDHFNGSDRNNVKDNFKDRGFKRNGESGEPEKLHPSWEAKKRQSGILPFQGKKIVFDES